MAQQETGRDGMLQSERNSGRFGSLRDGVMMKGQPQHEQTFLPPPWLLQGRVVRGLDGMWMKISAPAVPCCLNDEPKGVKGRVHDCVSPGIFSP